MSYSMTAILKFKKKVEKIYHNFLLSSQRFLVRNGETLNEIE